jgi:CheY-like chemotaxis protein
VLETRLLDLNTLVSDAETLLRRLVGERVTFDVAVAPQPLPVRGDPVLLEQVLVNLVLNARDAVTQRPEGGLITVETAELTLDPERAPACGARPGKYVRFSVHDTGPGMDAETRARVFEPFFTTKPVGEGTGLGLAMVQNIVTQLGGTVHVESEPGHGSTFRVLLPRAAEEGAEGLTETPPVVAPHGRETVLLVEDEAAVRDVARRILERAGYTVYEARHGADALLVWREQGGARGNIDVLLTDVRMPELGGRELAAALRRERPDLPVVFVSGYAQSETRGAGERELFVAKPFVAPELQSAVRQVLDAARSAA